MNEFLSTQSKYIKMFLLIDINVSDGCERLTLSKIFWGTNIYKNWVEYVFTDFISHSLFIILVFFCMKFDQTYGWAYSGNPCSSLKSVRPCAASLSWTAYFPPRLRFTMHTMMRIRRRNAIASIMPINHPRVAMLSDGRLVTSEDCKISFVSIFQ